MAETAGGGSQFSRLDALCLSPTSREIHPEEQNIYPLLNRRDIAGCEINCEADSIGLPAMFFVAAFVLSSSSNQVKSGVVWWKIC